MSICPPTTPLPRQADAGRTELGNLLREAIARSNGAALDKRRHGSLREQVEVLIDDDEFWRLQANSLAVLATRDHIDAVRLANARPALVEVSRVFHLKPLLRAVTFPHAAFVLVLSENDSSATRREDASMVLAPLIRLASSTSALPFRPRRCSPPGPRPNATSRPSAWWCAASG